MELINYNKIIKDIDSLRKDWSDKRKPFHYLIYDGFFTPEAAEMVLKEYPKPTQEWNGTTYVHQKNKFTLTKFSEDLPVLKQVFDELNSEKFLSLLSDITGIPGVLSDNDLFGGGLHQSLKGAFLNVHVDFNLHEKTKYHRRMNAIVYMNKDWKEEYNGYLELWDMKEKKQLEYIAPLFNRLVIFETNEVSYHGHPKPLNAPEGISRKSLATYYYTKERPTDEIAKGHNTIYVNTEGGKGLFKILFSGIKAAFERIGKKS
jgi:hypothetical protein